MSKRIEIDGKFYRKREGKLVQIPDEWVGKTLNSNTKRKRKNRKHKSIAREINTKGRFEYFANLGMSPPSKSYDWSRYKLKRDQEKLISELSLL